MLLPSIIFSCLIGVPFAIISVYYHRKIQFLNQNSQIMLNNSLQQTQKSVRIDQNTDNELAQIQDKEKHVPNQNELNKQSETKQQQNQTFQPNNLSLNKSINTSKKKDSDEKENEINNGVNVLVTNEQQNDNELLDSSKNREIPEEQIQQNSQKIDSQQGSLNTNQSKLEQVLDQKVEQNHQLQNQNQEIMNCLNTFERIQTTILFLSFICFIEANIGRIYIKLTNQKVQFPSLLYQGGITSLIVIILFNLFGQLLYHFFENSQEMRIILRFLFTIYGLAMTFLIYQGFDDYLDLECLTVSVAIIFSFILQLIVLWIGKTWKSQQIQLIRGWIQNIKVDISSV